MRVLTISNHKKGDLAISERPVLGCWQGKAVAMGEASVEVMTAVVESKMEEYTAEQLNEAMAADGFIIARLDEDDDPTFGDGFWFKVTSEPYEGEDGDPPFVVFRASVTFEFDDSTYHYSDSNLERIVAKCMKQGFSRSRYLAICQTREAQLG
jgi:hypothetical protein